MFIDELRKKKDQLIAISRKYKARNIQVFGSVARGEETKHSDVDILISLPKAYDMFKQRIPLQEELKKAIGRRVDLIVRGEINRHIKPRIMAEARDL